MIIMERDFTGGWSSDVWEFAVRVTCSRHPYHVVGAAHRQCTVSRVVLSPQCVITHASYRWQGDISIALARLR